MKKGVTLVPWTDLLHYSKKIGYSWNQAHDILVNDEVPPMYEINTRTYYLEELGNGKTYEEDPELGCGYDWSKDSIKIVIGFMKENKLKEMTVTRD